MGSVEFEAIQGIVRFGYGKLTDCCFLLATIKDAEKTRGWIETAPVTNAVALSDAPQTALQVAFTYEGLTKLGCSSALLSQFSTEFKTGLNNNARARLLGDVGESAPEQWFWGSENNKVDVLVMLYARPGGLDAWKEAIQSGGWNEAFRVVSELNTSYLGGTEPFGFTDGVSQPELDWERSRVPQQIEDTYTNRITLGEVLLGYPNEYNRYTDRPLLPSDASSADLLPVAEDQPNMRDFGRNGSYLVLRTLEQNVDEFWRFIRGHSEDEATAEMMAEAMVGRRKDGTPLVPLSSSPIPGVDTNDNRNHFDFASDPDGLKCPFGAHIRRANPRNGDLPSPPVSGIKRLLTLLGLGEKTLNSDAKASSRFHRILRRGREFKNTPISTQTDETSTHEGIHFMCLNANLARQFEFLQSAWLMSTKFDALTDESDPLLGSRERIEGAAPPDSFTLPSEQLGERRTVGGIPRFVRVRGGAYFFLPSLATLRYLTAIGQSRE
ncbi:Dyp-type peroxidase [Terriglobus roseus]|uniref:Dyp-type peroxidase family n=1 Tax=Terriglobus roseus TaxID=392734 RepID=A0A1G7GTU2_9BACT|nr:hypothetical protein [Terriglobus roseus]SDE91567.1 hypothetical protein SAMN05444167_0800 [Terriglobus roseus]